MGALRIGMLTPSSNTALEPWSTAMLRPLDGVSVHFARFPVTSISLAPTSLQQFAPEPMLAAAALLADARVHVIAWNGTSGAWLGLDHDRRLCEAIAERTGTPATTSTLATVEALRLLGVHRFGLAVPYTDAVAHRIASTFGAAGFTCAARACLGLVDNFSFSQVDPGTIADLVRRAGAGGAQAVTVQCTNLPAAPLAAELEQALGVPVVDSIAVTAWKALRLAGDARRFSGWGRVLAEY